MEPVYADTIDRAVLLVKVGLRTSQAEHARWVNGRGHVSPTTGKPYSIGTRGASSLIAAAWRRAVAYRSQEEADAVTIAYTDQLGRYSYE